MNKKLLAILCVGIIFISGCVQNEPTEGNENNKGSVQGINQIVNFTQKYGNPILNMRRENSYHVKWYNDGEVIYWHTIIFNSEYKSKLYFYLPLAYDNDQNNKV